MIFNLPTHLHTLAAWLLLLRVQGETMRFVPSDMRLKAETIQHYVMQINQLSTNGRKYRVRCGVSRNPITRRRAYRDQTIPVYVILIHP